MTEETRTNAPAMLASGVVLAAILVLVAAVSSAEASAPSFTAPSTRLGIDLASQPEHTAICSVRWDQGRATVEGVRCDVDDDDLVAAIAAADKVGIDVPFGWPDAFVKAVAAYSQTGRWPTTRIERSKTNKPLYFRATDHFIYEQTRRWPLSVSSDRIAIPAIRAAALFTRLADEGQAVARDGAGKVVEVYPAAALRAWQFEPTKYKRKENRDARCKLLADIRCRTERWLDLRDDDHRLCEDSDDALDALVAALIARAAAVGQCEPIPDNLSAVAKREGWISLPK